MKMAEQRYRQTKEVRWLKTPVGTIWKKYGFENYIQPEDTNLWETMFGVDLDLLDEDTYTLFEIIE